MLLAAVACAGDPASPGAGRPPSIAWVALAPNPNNTLSTVVTFATRNTDSARVLYRPAASGPGYAFATPFYAVQSYSGRIAVLGLPPDAVFDVAVEARGAGADTSASAAMHSGVLPPPLAGLRLDVTGTPTPGYTLTDFTRDTTAFIVAFDSTGQVRWYRQFTARGGALAIDAEQRTNGDYTLFIGVSTGWQPTWGRFDEVTAAGDLVRSYTASAPYYTDPHELLLDFSGAALDHVHLLGYDLRRTDLTALGGRPDQLLAGHVILRQSASGSVEFLWNAWDHLSLADWIFVQPNLAQFPSIDFDHPNSLVLDADGNYIVSFASLGEITKIDAVTGQMLWRFGGRNNQFSIVGDPLGGFGIQHDVRVLPTGNLVLFDNGTRHQPPESRAVEYQLDLRARTATLVWQYRHTPPVFAPFAGSAQRLANGDTFVSFGANPRVAEVAPDGRAIWEGRVTTDGQPVPFFYRATHVASLYRFERP